jgi:hypothetical protein
VAESRLLADIHPDFCRLALQDSGARMSRQARFCAKALRIN